MRIGLVGLPNAGKSTIFNALTKGRAKVERYPFTTIEPNIGKAEVPDERLNKLKEFINAQESIPVEIEFVDIAGLIEGASKGEGLGNQFLAQIRDVDLILHVVRAFQEPDIPHRTLELKPDEDITLVNLELMLSDLEIVERALEKLKRPEDKERKEFLLRVKEYLSRGVSPRSLQLKEEEKRIVKEYGLISFKPVVYVINLGEGETEEDFRGRLSQDLNAPIVCIYGKLEEELSQLSPEERKEFREAWGIGEGGLEKVVRVCYDMLSLITFYTIARGKLRAWALERGKSIIEAAEKIHTDMAKGFIKGEVIGVDDLLKFSSYSEAKEKGVVKIVGKDYEVKDGDVVFIHFH